MTATLAPAPTAATSPRAARQFWLALGGIGVLALVIRVTWVLVARRTFALHGDDFYYHWQANALADGMGYLNPLAWRALGRLDPSAGHPPLYSTYLAVVSWFGGTTPVAHRLASCLLGAGGVVLIGVTALEIAGRRAALIAASLAAVYPMLWINDGMLTSESMYVPLVALMLLFAYRMWKHPTWPNAVFLGGAIGFAALTRPEAVMLVPLMGVPFVFAKSVGQLARRIGLFVLIGVACLVVILPWWVRNLTTFEQPVFLATGHGSVLESANCDATYSGRFLGYWNVDCLVERRPPQGAAQEALIKGQKAPGSAYFLLQDSRDESVADVGARNRAFDYIDEHLGRVPLVATARVARVWGLYRVDEGVNFDIFFERRGEWPSWTGTFMYYGLAAFSLVALIEMRKRKVPISPVIAILIGVTVSVAISIGITRYRIAGDVTLVILAGVGIDALWRRWRRRSSPPDDTLEQPLEATTG